MWSSVWWSSIMSKAHKNVDRSIKKKWACNECDNLITTTVTTNVVTNVTLWTLSKVKAHKCDTCGESFTHKGYLTQLMKKFTLKILKLHVSFVIKCWLNLVCYVYLLKFFIIKIDLMLVLNVIKHSLKVNTSKITWEIQKNTKEKSFQCSFCYKSPITSSHRSINVVSIK